MKDGIFISQRAVEVSLFVFVALFNWGAANIATYGGMLAGAIAILAALMVVHHLAEILLEKLRGHEGPDVK